MALCRRGG